MIETLHIDQYNYFLPEERIATYPLLDRESSRLLLYDQGNIKDLHFNELPSLITSGALMVFNNSKVVPARLVFLNEQGAHIEVFCLEPVDPKEYNISFGATESVIWRATIGNKKRWKKGLISIYNPSNQKYISDFSLTAECLTQEDSLFLVRFKWCGGLPFSTILALCGEVPIPPYLGRHSEEIDIERYQTIYASIEGSVAAPTAGLHFSENLINSLKKRNILLSEVTLHVGAGTFMPVKVDHVYQHYMHSEPFTVSISFLEQILSHKGAIITVGTTSARCLESLYYFGLMCFQGQEPTFLSQWDTYHLKPLLTREDSLMQIITFLKKHNLNSFTASTQIMIVPSFTFRWINGLITNFHQPKSTLLLLIAAFIGADWRKCYTHALEEGYRFLSYGDSSLLLPNGW